MDITSNISKSMVQRTVNLIVIEGDCEESLRSSSHQPSDKYVSRNRL